MATATYRGTVLADSENGILVENNVYFPPDSVDRRRLVESDTHTTCPWKGRASYYHVSVGDEMLRDAAWYYPKPKPAAAEIRDYIAFGPVVTVERSA